MKLFQTNPYFVSALFITKESRKQRTQFFLTNIFNAGLPFSKAYKLEKGG
ncbi:hypothetical protein KFK09_011330 [Dendrobium nobile]|uniref:Uncharacterized protein n=1 Tax=Dendrobium nobile TaxID=94219 RepID=A0A8T3BFF3_DENNO|nr:hypothetical protein KFK09_011330 [Dendrobium nobile]